MRNILKNRKALSTVVTTLIILVVSVLLAGVVTYFAINVTSTRVQEENLHLTKQHIWYAPTNNTPGAEAALVIINTGGRDCVLDKVTVRGQECVWTNVFYNVSTTAINNDLTWENDTLSSGGTISAFSGCTVIQATNDIILPSGKTMVLYIVAPDSISVNDVGLTVPITIFSSQAMYYKETNVQAV